jgi:NADH-quinone oxidoreductase subunit J
MTYDIVVFYLIAFTTIISAILVITMKDIFRCAIALMMMFVAIAAIFITLEAEFIAAIQILVYAGAVVVLILFAIMLTKRDGERDRIPVFRGLASLLFLLVMILYLGGMNWWRYAPPTEAEAGSTALIGTLLFSEFVLPFEVISLILLAAMIGAIYLAKKEVVE